MSVDPVEFRELCRSGKFQNQTSGQCPGYAQANLVILPSAVAGDFRDLCIRNPVPLPLLGMSASPGDFSKIDDSRVLADNTFDIRKDFPSYNVYEKGTLMASPSDISSLWNKQSVAFLIGCSFSFEHALDQAGLPAKNSVLKKNVSMYKTSKMLDSAGIFVNVPYVVSMRPYKVKDVETVRAVTRKYRKTHGEPIDWGFEALARLGIEDLRKPDYGDATELAEDEIPVFWGCGVTAQVAAMSVASQIEGNIIGHAPGCMLVLDIQDEDIVSMI